MRRLLSGVIWTIGLVVGGAAYFLVPLGRYTLHEHVRRIAATEPAQELGAELEVASDALTERALEEFEARQRADGREPIRVAIASDGALRVDGERIEEPAFRAHVRALRREGELYAVVDADRETSDARVEQVVAILREEGVERVVMSLPTRLR